MTDTLPVEGHAGPSANAVVVRDVPIRRSKRHRTHGGVLYHTSLTLLASGGHGRVGGVPGKVGGREGGVRGDGTQGGTSLPVLPRPQTTRLAQSAVVVAVGDVEGFDGGGDGRGVVVVVVYVVGERVGRNVVVGSGRRRWLLLWLLLWWWYRLREFGIIITQPDFSPFASRLRTW